MIRHLSRGLALVLMLSSLSLNAAEHTQLKAFPDAQQGMQRYVIELTHKERDGEQDFRVQLIVGKNMETDGINLIRLGTSIEALPLKGWGYTYYEAKPESATLSTMMAAPEGAPQVMQFVIAAPLMIRYNSRLPIVVYVPVGYEVRYRVWAASGPYTAAGPS
jgi:ecotin